MNWIFLPPQIRKLCLTGLYICFLLGWVFFAPSCALAALPPGEYELPQERSIKLPAKIKPYSPYAGRPYAGLDFPQQVFWGDTHLHTVYSFDAGAAGTLLTPEASYRFARGEEVTTDAGEPVQLSRPLDFLVVTDHTDQLGAFGQFISNPPQDCGDDQDLVDGWHEDINNGGDDAAKATNEIVSAFAQGTVPVCMLQTKKQFRTAWAHEVAWAEEFNDPHKFTAVIGYEWTSLDGGNNLHRNVIFRDNAEKALRFLPKTTQDGTDPELLWKWMENYEDATGGDVLAIPHNGNMSNGEMFADTDARNMPLTHSYAEQRQRWEPLYEVIQEKGAGETHPYLSPDDEFASFEIAGWDNGNLDLTHPKRTKMFEHEYARAALKNGLKFDKELGANPFKIGLVGSSDAHTALTAMEENSYMGKFPIDRPSPDRAVRVAKTSSFRRVARPADEVQRFGWQYGAAGYVGVWAQENTRESLFDAMERREVYASSGPRMTVRFFGGWDFTPEDVSFNPGQVGYAKGVPMGSDLSIAPEGKVPTFLVAALKDPIRGNLDRIQIVKGWLDASGATQEKVYDVVWSGDRVPGADGKLPLVGSLVNSNVTEPLKDTGTVNTDTATWTNTIGSTELAQVWTDPDFDPTERAFYYARVLEIPTPRWTDYDKAFYGEDWKNACADAKVRSEYPVNCDDIPLTLQERAYTSPIWYSPA